jgi:hypothetical protein
MPQKITSLKLNTQNKKRYLILNTFIFGLISLLAIIIIFKVIFPSQYFTYSFKNTNSLKNTITEMSASDQGLRFFATTPLKFSHIKINLELDKDTNSIDQNSFEIQKSYKTFFYPQEGTLENLANRQENILSSLDDSVFIVGNNKKTPIDSTETFEALGYNWANVAENKEDLSTYEKQKLADINAPHPDGTVLKTTKNTKFYFIENQTKKELLSVQSSSIKNPILVDMESLNLKEICPLEKNLFSNKKYHCTTTISQINNLLGKDYKFNLAKTFPDLNIDKLDIEFKKSINLENFNLFLFELKKKVLYRFGVKDF